MAAYNPEEDPGFGDEAAQTPIAVLTWGRQQTSSKKASDAPLPIGTEAEERALASQKACSLSEASKAKRSCIVCATPCITNTETHVLISVMGR